jgi:hypothetical protein
MELKTTNSGDILREIYNVSDDIQAMYDELMNQCISEHEMFDLKDEIAAAEERLGILVEYAKCEGLITI